MMLQKTILSFRGPANFQGLWLLNFQEVVLCKRIHHLEPWGDHYTIAARFCWSESKTFYTKIIDTVWNIPTWQHEQIRATVQTSSNIQLSRKQINQQIYSKELPSLNPPMFFKKSGSLKKTWNFQSYFLDEPVTVNSHHFIHFTNTNHQIDLYEFDLWKKKTLNSFVNGCSNQQKHRLKGFLFICFFQLIQIFLIWWQAEVSCILVPLERYTSISKDIYILYKVISNL